MTGFRQARPVLPEGKRHRLNTTANLGNNEFALVGEFVPAKRSIPSSVE